MNKIENTKQNDNPTHSIETMKEWRAAFQSANAVVDLAGLPFNEKMAAMQEKIICGELTIDEAIEQRVAEIKARQK